MRGSCLDRCGSPSPRVSPAGEVRGCRFTSDGVPHPLDGDVPHPLDGDVPRHLGNGEGDVLTPFNHDEYDVPRPLDGDVPGPPWRWHPPPLATATTSPTRPATTPLTPLRHGQRGRTFEGVFADTDDSFADTDDPFANTDTPFVDDPPADISPFLRPSPTSTTTTMSPAVNDDDNLPFADTDAPSPSPTSTIYTTTTGGYSTRAAMRSPSPTSRMCPSSTSRARPFVDVARASFPRRRACAPSPTLCSLPLLDTDSDPTVSLLDIDHPAFAAGDADDDTDALPLPHIEHPSITLTATTMSAGRGQRGGATVGGRQRARGVG
ncbi:hypothetical protein GGF50DRAFT_121324 [Schizophyllum commune]